LHLWFIGHLLLYSAVYVAWRQSASGQPGCRSPPNHFEIVGFVFALSLATWIVRAKYPVDKWVPLLWIMPAEPAHLPQYLALFTAGIAAYRGDWFHAMRVLS
jgi:glucans biosynthesis protein C